MNDPRYPIGQFTRQAVYSSAEVADFIQTLEQFPRLLRTAMVGLSQAQLETPYRQGGWTVQQLVHHVADSHMNAYVRIKLALTEDTPTIKPYEEAAWAVLPDSSLPVSVSLSLLEGLHLRWTSLLKGCSAADWQRGYLHPASGAWTIEPAMGLYAWHCQHHLEHILALKARQNW